MLMYALLTPGIGARGCIKSDGAPFLISDKYECAAPTPTYMIKRVGT